MTTHTLRKLRPTHNIWFVSLLRRVPWEQWPLLVTALAMLAYVLVVGTMVITRHQHFGSFAYDLGIYDQALWLISQGHSPYITVRDLHALGDHCTPILYLLALLYRLGWGTEGLLWTQTLALALGVVPLYRIAWRASGSGALGCLAALTYLLYPALRSINLFDFHPIALAIPGILFAFDFAFTRRWGSFLIACAWIMLCKQEATVTVVCLALWYAIRWREPRALFPALGALLWLGLALWLQAYFAGTSESAYAELYSRFGGSTGEIIQTFLLRPWVPFASLDWGETIAYLLLLVAPLALLPLGKPGILWLLAVPLLLNLFSNRIVMRGIQYQYTALLIPVLFCAAAIAVASISDRATRRLACSCWAICSLVSFFAFEPMRQADSLRPPVSAEDARQVRAILASLPSEASVAATQSLVPHLTGRRQIHMFPNPFWRIATGPSRLALRQQLGLEHPPVDSRLVQANLATAQVEYLVLGYRLGRIHGYFPIFEPQFVQLASEVLASPAYGLIRSEAGIWILQRQANHGDGLRRLGLPPTADRVAIEKRVRDLMLEDAAARPKLSEGGGGIGGPWMRNFPAWREICSR